MDDGGTPGKLLLVLGATGYVGGRLVPRLLAEGHRVRCLARRPDALAGRSWSDDVEIVQHDLTEQPEQLPDAFAGVDIAYHLVTR